MIRDILVSEREAMDALANHFLKRVEDAIGIAMVVKAGGKTFGHVAGKIGLAQEERTAITRNLAPIEISHHIAGKVALKLELKL